MIQERPFVGIDVSKSRFDGYNHPSGASFSAGNSPSEIAALTRRVVALHPIAVGLEASGGYERKLADSLHAAGIEVYILPPARVRGFARAIGQIAKTDAIDAAMIGQYLAATHHRLKPYTPDPARSRLSALAAHRRRLVAEKSGLASQLDTIDEPMVRNMIETRLIRIAQDVVMLDKAVRALLATTAELDRRYKRLRQVAGVGPVFATALLADLPELGQVSPKVVAALVGVAPHARQSGASQRPGRCTGGRKHLRDIAYMGTLSAIKAKDAILEPFYKRLRNNGKPFKLAMVATMRKLLTILNAIARTDPAFA
ncbi:MAG: IS110 family transposase [Burkholderiales bacterium]|nr:MAG: IS110 family transposase [Burkholderiales bacterium]